MNEITCYELVDQEFKPNFAFPGLRVFEPQNDDNQCNFNCLSYRSVLGEYEEKLKQDLHKKISDLGYKPLEKLKDEKSYYQKLVDKLVFKNFINPLSKTKENKYDRLVPPITYIAVPSIGIPASFIVDSLGVSSDIPEMTLIGSLALPILLELIRRGSLYQKKVTLNKTKISIRDPKTKFFDDLKKGKTKISVDTVFVKSASDYINKIKDPDVFPSVDFNRVNEKLFSYYEPYLSQPKA